MKLNKLGKLAKAIREVAIDAVTTFILAVGIVLMSSIMWQTTKMGSIILLILYVLQVFLTCIDSENQG